MALYVEIPLDFVFKRFYCCKCGQKLKKKKKIKFYYPQDEEYEELYKKIHRHYFLSVGFRTKIKTTKRYFYCENCNYNISYNKQTLIAERQKCLKTKILPEEDL